MARNEFNALGVLQVQVSHCPVILNPKLPTIQNIITLLATPDSGHLLTHASNL